MPWGLTRFQQSHHLHFVTFSCYRRQPFLDTPRAKRVFEHSLEQTRRSYQFYVIGYVVMPEHVHLLLSEPDRATLATALAGAEAIGFPKTNRTPRKILANALLRLQRLEPREAHRETQVHPPQPCQAWTRRETGRLGVEQLSPLRIARDGSGGD